jgi:hypothetical protein
MRNQLLIAFFFVSLGWVSGPALAVSDEPSNWNVRIDVDPFTNRPDASARIENDNGDVLSIACNGNEESILSLQFLPKRYLGTRNNLVLTKVGGNKPIEATRWEYSSKGAYTTNETFLLSFARQLSKKSQRILVRAYNFENQPVNASFNSTNAWSAFLAIAKACATDGS